MHFKEIWGKKARTAHIHWFEMSLCGKCQQIPESFFQLHHNPRIEVEHYTVEDFLKWETRNCPLCSVWNQNLSFLAHTSRNAADKAVFNRQFVKLRREAQKSFLFDSGIRNGNGDPYLYTRISVMLQGVDIFISSPTAKFGRVLLGSLAFEQVPDMWRKLPKLSIGSASDELLHMRTWIEDCTQNHRKCVSLETKRPTRLLDLSHFEDSKDLILVHTSTIPKVDMKYTTLSHCWGSPGPVKTTTWNLQAHMERISFEKLSTTFQDAIKTTRSINVRYLWIDSLCIIQDSLEDWKYEAGIMGQIYKSSFLTLAASSSSDGSGGCKFSALNSPVQDLEIGEVRLRFLIGNNLKTARNLGSGGPLQTRGWALQERFLSTRSIHFTDTSLLWECQTKKAIIELPWLNQDQKGPAAEAGMPRLFHDSLAETSGKNEASLVRDTWFIIMEDYSRRNLTYLTDKLPALAGLAQHFSKKSQGKYLAGLWENQLPSALLWKVLINGKSKVPQRPADYVAPTWSCLSIDGEILYNIQYRTRTEPKFGGKDSHTRSTPEYNFGKFKILQASVTPSGANPFGAVSAASLRLEGCIIGARIGAKVKASHSSTVHLRMLLNSKNAVMGILYPDIPLDVHEQQQVSCISIRDESIAGGSNFCPSEMREAIGADSGPLVMGIAVVESDLELGAYKRVGLIRWMIKSYFDVETREILLV